MKRTLRLLSLLLACLLATATLAACDLSDVLDGLDSPDSSTVADNATETTPAEETKYPEKEPSDTYFAETDPWWVTEPETSPAVDEPGVEIETAPGYAPEDALNALESINWGGEDFTVLCGMTMKSEMHSAEIGSSIIGDAVYERNVLLEELCNLKWTVREAATDQGMTNTIQNEAMVAAGDFQLIDHYAGYTVSHASSGFLDSFRNLGREDLSGPWWDQGTDAFLLGGQVYFMSGSANTLDDDVTYVMYFNRKLQAELPIEDPYQTVLDGNWTLDYFSSLVQAAAVDNGDGKWDEQDTYGLATYYGFTNAFFIGADLRYTDNSSQDGAITMVIHNRMEKAQATCDLLRSFYTPATGTFSADQGQYDLAASLFKTGRCLFYGDVIGSRTATEEEYGILPVPKFDVKQTEYRSRAHVSAAALSVPTTVGVGDKAETVGGILEALAILSHKTVRTAYCESVLKVRKEQEPAAFAMLDIALDNRAWDLAFFISEQTTEAVFEKAVSDGDLTVQVNRLVKTLPKQLEKLSAQFEELHT